MHLFHNSLEGTFLERPNRFLIRVRTERGEITAHCPNPGRMEELFFPGSRLILEQSLSPERKYPYSLAAAYYDGKVIPLNSSRVNRIAEECILQRLYPGAGRIIREYPYGNSRFDFLIRHRERSILLEVKGCTLVHQGVAMFPDAPTKRGTRHVKELAGCTGDLFEPAILFVIMHGDTDRFIPNIHTDPDFSLALEQASAPVTIHAVSMQADSGGSIEPVRFDIPVLLEPVNLVRENRGCYLLVLHRKRSGTCRVGRLGTIDIPRGYYVYTGSAKKNLSSRVARHLRKRKKVHWHIDYLVQSADSVKAYPVRTRKDMECSIASMISRISDGDVPGFGCSDCSCRSHLFYFTGNPAENRRFTNAVLHIRHVMALDDPIPSRH